MTGGWSGPVAQRRLLAALWLLLIFCVSAFAMRVLDIPASEAMRGLPPAVHHLFGAITVAGLGKWYLWSFGLAAAALAGASYATTDSARAGRYRSLAWALLFVFLAVLLSGLATDLIKVVVGRSRPKLLAAAGIYGFAPFSFRSDHQSFPSGHATTAVALAAAVGCLWPRLRLPLALAAAAIAVSRIVVNAHFLGDVIGGAAVGAGTVWLLREAFAGRCLLFEHDPDGMVRRLDHGSAAASEPDV